MVLLSLKRHSRLSRQCPVSLKNVLDYFAVPGPHILAHRGYATTAPENSMGAFEAAVSAGATHVETDVHLTRDGIVVLFHDDELDGRRIGSYLKSELPEHVPALDDVLRSFPQTRFNIDIKDPAAAVPTAGIIRVNQADSRVLIASFSTKRRRVTADLLNNVAQSAGSTEFAVALLAAKLRQGWLVRRALRHVDALQIPTRIGWLTTVTTSTMRMFHSAGVVVHVWTINDPHEMRRLVGLGVRGVVTDETAIAVQTLRTPPTSS